MATEDMPTQGMAKDSGTQPRRIWRQLAGLWLPPLAWMAVIFYFSSQSGLPQAESGPLDFAIKKMAHLFEYGLLGGLLLRACQGSAAMRRTQALRSDHQPVLDGPALAAIGLATLWAVLDEVHQSFVPTRSATVRDVLIDFAAILVSVLVARWWQRRRKK